VDLGSYRNKLLDRFSNPHIEDTLLRLAEDGSQKLQTTMRPVLLDHFTAGRVSTAMAAHPMSIVRFLAS
jgi:mannitol-1-phosphate/altronate dehydrogenase